MNDRLPAFGGDPLSAALPSTLVYRTLERFPVPDGSIIAWRTGISSITPSSWTPVPPWLSLPAQSVLQQVQFLELLSSKQSLHVEKARQKAQGKCKPDNMGRHALNNQERVSKIGTKESFRLEGPRLHFFYPGRDTFILSDEHKGFHFCWLTEQTSKESARIKKHLPMWPHSAHTYLQLQTKEKLTIPRMCQSDQMQCKGTPPPTADITTSLPHTEDTFSSVLKSGQS